MKEKSTFHCMVIILVKLESCKRSDCLEIVVASPPSFSAGPWIEIPCRSVANEWWLVVLVSSVWFSILRTDFSSKKMGTHILQANSGVKKVLLLFSSLIPFQTQIFSTQRYKDTFQTQIFSIWFDLGSSCRFKIRFLTMAQKGYVGRVLTKLHSPNVNCFLKSHIIYCICRSYDRAKCNDLAIHYTLLWLLQAALSVNSSLYLISGSITLFLFLP